MASPSVLTKKASLLGTWQEDVFTDELLKKIATYAAVEKGKKAKVKLSGAGLRVLRSRFLQADASQFYAFNTLKTVARNPNAPRCVMFILADPRRKYQIIAVRCVTEEDAYDLVNFTAKIKKEEQISNVEFKKRENGNWTLRDRSAHNANRHMAELFSEQQTSDPATAASSSPRPQNGDTQNHVPVLDASRSNQARGSYVKRQHSNSAKKNVKEYEKNGEYIVETEVETGEPAVNGKVVGMSDQADGNKQSQSGLVAAYSNYVQATKAQQEVLPSRSVVMPSQPQHPQILRATSRSNDPKMAGPTMTYFADSWGPHRRVSGSFTLAHRARGRTDSFQGSNKVSFDTESIASNMSRKSRSLRSIPTTIERSIEDTYAPRQVAVLRRHGSVQLVGARPRPMSYHVMRTNELQVFSTKGRNYDDVAL